jgi:hypothetical protein
MMPIPAAPPSTVEPENGSMLIGSDFVERGLAALALPARRAAADPKKIRPRP